MTVRVARRAGRLAVGLARHRTRFPALYLGGLLMSDDVFQTPAYWWFTTTRRVPFVHVGNMAVTRKR